jgi:hypothetical protein
VNSHEREILGVEGISGLMSLAEAVGMLVAKDEERENTRVLLREKDDYWRDRMDEKTDDLCKGQQELKDAISHVPEIANGLIDAAIATHEKKTNSMRRTSSWVLVAVLCMLALAVAGTLEMVDKEKTAAYIIFILIPFAGLAGGFLSRKG